MAAKVGFSGKLLNLLDTSGIKERSFQWYRFDIENAAFFKRLNLYTDSTGRHVSPTNMFHTFV